MTVEISISVNGIIKYQGYGEAFIIEVNVITNTCLNTYCGGFLRDICSKRKGILTSDSKTLTTLT